MLKVINLYDIFVVDIPLYIYMESDECGVIRKVLEQESDIIHSQSVKTQCLIKNCQ